MAVTISRISPDELERQIAAGRGVTIVDVRQPDSYDASPVKIKGAIRIAPDEIERRYDEIPKGKPIVTY